MRLVRRRRLISSAGCFLAIIVGLATGDLIANDEACLQLGAQGIRIAIAEDFSLTVFDDTGKTTWTTHPTTKPSLMAIKANGRESKGDHVRCKLGEARNKQVQVFDDGEHRGHKFVLSGFPKIDVCVQLILALSSSHELLVEIRQTGGSDRVQAAKALYDWSLAPDSDNYFIVPLGSGYLIRANQPNDVNLDGFVGAKYSLPLFGMVCGNRCCYQIVESWWDAKVHVKGGDGEGINLQLDWEPALGSLAYPRRVLIRFADNLDHLGVAKAYRGYLAQRGQLSTLKERAEKLPALRKYLSGVEYRWTHHDPARENEEQLVLENIQRFQAAGIPITFFYPKWPSQGHEPFEPNSAAWQASLLDEPLPGGWPAIVDFANQVRKLGCSVKVMVTPHLYLSGAPEYDLAKATGQRLPNLSMRYATWANDLVLNRLRQRGLEYDAVYYDGYAAHMGFQEHRDAQGPVSRRESFEAQVACFRQTRSFEIVPGAELARFWAIGECDFFFFTDWSEDRLAHGEPVPLFPLVFHDCYAAHFSGGGYYNEGKYDWYADRHPRLYELMYAAMPSHNWLPAGSKPIEREDWDTPAMKQRLEWLRLWHAYYQKVRYEEMLSHKFLNQDHTLQQVEFDGGVTAEFDLAQERFRIRGIQGISEAWKTPPKLPHTYRE